jgi:hypothetical protein
MATIVFHFILFLFYSMDIFYILGDCHLYDYLKENKMNDFWVSWLLSFLFYVDFKFPNMPKTGHTCFHLWIYYSQEGNKWVTIYDECHFVDVTPCGSCKKYCLVLPRKLCRLLLSANLVPRSPILVNQMLEVLGTPKCPFLQEPHGVTSQKTTFF